MYRAMQRVIKNKGSHGVDGIKTDELHDYCKSIGLQLNLNY